MDPEISTSQKRSHDVFEDRYSQWPSQLPELEPTFSVPADLLSSRGPAPAPRIETPVNDFPPPLELETNSQPSPSTNPRTPLPSTMKRSSSPTRSSTGSLTEAGPDTPSRGTTPIHVTATMPTMTIPQSTTSAFAAMTGNAAPPAKRARLTFEEKELKRINKEIKDRERAEERARKEAEKAAGAEEKARKEAEREVERKKVAEEKARKDAEKEVERKKQAEEKARKDAEKEAEKKRKEAEKEEKRIAVEAARKKKEEEKQKKDKGQMKLGNFFALPAQSARNRSGSVESRGRNSMSPAPTNSITGILGNATPSKKSSKPQLSAYEKMFPDFFLQTGVTLAPTNRFERDSEASEVLHTTLDSYLDASRSPGGERPFDAASLFRICPHNVPRGRRRMPVREIMAEFYSGKALNVIDLTTDSQNSQIKRTTDLLRRVPMKFLKFQEDVRPPYRGTYTARPITSMEKLARNPLRRDLPDTNYDYDSEAEWVEGDEDAEDLKSEGDDEEELDDDEDMGGFLDDEGDDTPHKRMVLQGDLEPISTGMCWEDRTKRNTNVKMVAYRMEIILDPTIKSIDPFSTSYWDPPQTTSMDPPRIPLHNMRNTSLNFNGQPVVKPAKSFFAPPDAQKASASPKTPAGISKPKTKDSKPKELLPPEKIADFKKEIQANYELSKVGLIEMLKVKFKGHTAGSIKATLESVALKGSGKNSVWVLRDEMQGTAPVVA